MKKIAVALLLVSSAVVARDVWVKPHVRSDGTYVQGHYRSAPNNNVWDNYSTQGNTNPYTGQAGTVNPYGHQNTYRLNDYTPGMIAPATPFTQQPSQTQKTCFLNSYNQLQCY